MLSKLLFRLSAPARSSAQDETASRVETGLRADARDPSTPAGLKRRPTRWLDSLSNWWRGSAANASTQSRSDAAAARMAAIYLASTQPPDADTRLCPRVVDTDNADSRKESVRPVARTSRQAMKLAAQFAAARTELSAALADLHPDRQHDLQARIRQAQNMRDLWHLRPQIFTLISMELDQREAHVRLALVNRHFPVSAPKSSFGGFDQGL